MTAKFEKPIAPYDDCVAVDGSDAFSFLVKESKIFHQISNRFPDFLRKDGYELSKNEADCGLLAPALDALIIFLELQKQSDQSLSLPTKLPLLARDFFEVEVPVSVNNQLDGPITTFCNGRFGKGCKQSGVGIATGAALFLSRSMIRKARQS